MIMILDVDVTAERRNYNTHRPLAVTDLLDFQVADAPLQIQFASAKCVRCASLRSGGDSPIGLKVVDCPLGNDYEVGVTGIPFVSTVLHEVMLRPSSSGRWESCRGLPSRANI